MGLELQAVMSIQWVMGIKPECSGRAANEVISLASWIDDNFLKIFKTVRLIGLAFLIKIFYLDIMICHI